MVFPHSAGESDSAEFFKGSKFSVEETYALLEGLRVHRDAVVPTTASNYGIGSGKDQKATLRERKSAWKDIASRVNKVNNGEQRTAVQLKYRWKNLKQRAYKDYNSTVNFTGPDDFRRGEFSDMVIDLIGKERMEVMFRGGGKSFGVSSSADHQQAQSNNQQPSLVIAACSSQEVVQSPSLQPATLPTLVKEEVLSDDEPEVIIDEVTQADRSHSEQPPRKKLKVPTSRIGNSTLTFQGPSGIGSRLSDSAKSVFRTRVSDPTRSRIFSMTSLNGKQKIVDNKRLMTAEIERAQAETRLAKEEAKLVMLRQQEVRLRMLLLQSRLQDAGIEINEIDDDEEDDEMGYF